MKTQHSPSTPAGQNPPPSGRRPNQRTIPNSVRSSPQRAGRTRKSWREKLADAKDLPQVRRLAGDQAQRWGGTSLLIAAPIEVDEEIRKIPYGQILTVNELRTRLARNHGAEVCCPLTTGIFTWIAAHAALEDEADGRRTPTPWWRVVKEGRKLNPKFPGGVDEQTRRLCAEAPWQIVGGRVTHLPATRPAKPSKLSTTIKPKTK